MTVPKPAPPTAERVPLGRVATPPSPFDPATLPGRILVVDDDPDYLELISYQLRAAGHRVRTVLDPRQAVEAVATFKPDVVLTDQRMPDMTGAQVCAALRLNPDYAFLPVILLTHDASIDVTSAAVEAGVNDFMDKSSSAQVIRLRVKAALRTKRLGDEAARRIEEQVFLTHLTNELTSTLQEEAQLLMAARALSRFEPANLYVVSITDPDRPVLYSFGPIALERPSGRLAQIITMAQAGLRTNLDPDELHGQHHMQDWPPTADRPLVTRSLRATPRPLVWLAFEPTHAMEDDELRLFDGIVERLAAPVENARLYRQVQQAVNESSGTLEKLQRAQASLVHNEKLASIGQLAAGVAHEINNPLAFVISNLNVLREYARDLSQIIDFYRKAGAPEPPSTLQPDFLVSDLESLISESIEGASRVHGIVKNLKNFAHNGTGFMEEVDVQSALESTLNLLAGELRQRALVYRDIQSVPIVRGDRGKLNQVFLNLVVNASQAIPSGREGRIWVRLFNDGADVVFQVEDNGGGIPASVRERIFEPFFTTKEQGTGTGLGLPITNDIIRQHGGSLSFDTEEGRGTTFTVRLPARDTRPIPPIQAHAPSDDTSAVAVFIDDERFLLNAFKRAFSRTAHVQTAQGGEAGIKLLQGLQQVDVIFCDLIMGRVSGVDVYDWIAANRPELLDRFVVLTAGANDERFRSFVATTGCKVIYKPFTVHEVVEAINEKIRRPRRALPHTVPLD